MRLILYCLFLVLTVICLNIEFVFCKNYGRTEHVQFTQMYPSKESARTRIIPYDNNKGDNLDENAKLLSKGNSIYEDSLTDVTETTGVRRDDISDNDDSNDDFNQLNEYEQGVGQLLQSENEADDNDSSEREISDESSRKLIEPIGYDSTGLNFEDETNSKVSKFLQDQNSDESSTTENESYNDENTFLKSDPSTGAEQSDERSSSDEPSPFDENNHDESEKTGNVINGKSNLKNEASKKHNNKKDDGIVTEPSKPKNTKLYIESVDSNVKNSSVKPTKNDIKLAHKGVDTPTVGDDIKLAHKGVDTPTVGDDIKLAHKGVETPTVEDDINDDENIMLETQPQHVLANEKPVKSTGSSSKEEMINRFQAWGKELVKRRPNYNYESKLGKTKRQFLDWLENISLGNSKETKNPDFEKVLGELSHKIESMKEVKGEQRCGDCFSDAWLAEMRLNSFLQTEDRGRQKLLNQLYANTSKVTEQSLNDNIKWFTNITGINNTDSVLESIDLMSLDHGYHVRYPPNHLPNHLSYDVHLSNPFNQHVDYHVHHQGNKVKHYFDHYYNNGAADHAVDHFVSKMGPCMNGGIVVPLPDKQYQCICKKGYIGPKCEDFDYCSLKPCKNYGKCNPIDVTPRIHCTCSRDWYGKLCEKRNPCYPSPCKNNGKCSHDTSGSYECVCKTGYRGDRCQYVDSCYPSPCVNGGKCHSLQGDGEFYCECPQTHKGSLCQYPTICPQRPCQHGGECRETADSDFQCICTNGYFGKTCEQRPCSPSPCLNGATCVEEGLNSYTCLCNAYSTGVNCSDISPCKLKPCSQNGQCIDAYSGYKWSFKPMQYYCLCKPPWMGPYCTDNMCSHCSPYAHCDNDSKCICDDGYTGDGFVCEENEKNSCNPNPCMNDGKCFDRGQGDFECQCVLPYQPPLCLDTDPCKADPCHNGRCIPNSDGSYSCDCVEGFTGPNCNISNPCKPNPCQNHGTCVIENKKALCTCVGRWMPPICKECGCPKSSNPSTAPDSYCDEYGACQCYRMNNMTWSFTGTKCAALSTYTTQAPPGNCNPNPCRNGGTCIDTGNGHSCQCTRWFMGKSCQHLKACVPKNPCMNGGKCEENGTGGYSCKCPPGTIPPRCAAEPTIQASPTKHCAPEPCRNDGVCTEAFNGYDCNCKPRYTGPTCEIDRCQDCDDDAQCILGHCYCNEGFIGNGYQCQVDDTNQCDEQKCSQHGYCVQHACTCYPGYTMVNNVCMYEHHTTPASTTTTSAPATKAKPFTTTLPPSSSTLVPLLKTTTIETTTTKLPTTPSPEQTTPSLEQTTPPPEQTTTTVEPSTPPMKSTTTSPRPTNAIPLSTVTVHPPSTPKTDGGGEAVPTGSKKSLEKLLEIQHPPGSEGEQKVTHGTLRQFINKNRKHKKSEIRHARAKKKSKIEYSSDDIW